MEYAQFFRDRLFYKSDEFLQKATDKVEFEKITLKVIASLDFSNGLDRNRLLLSAYSVLKEAGVDDRKLALTLSLIDGGIEIIKRADTIHTQVMTELYTTVDELEKAEEPDLELINQIRKSIFALKGNDFNEVEKVIGGRVKREATPFEAAFLRNEFREHRRSLLGDNWKKFRDHIATMFGLSKTQLAAVKAWEATSLRNKGGKTIDQLIDAMHDSSNGKPVKTNGKPVQSVRLSEDGKTYIRDYVEAGSTEDEKITRRREVAEVFGVSIQTVAAVTAWTKIRANRVTAVSNPTPVSADAPAPNSNLIESDDEKLLLEGGEHFNYNNENKRAWRKKIKEFIDANTTFEHRAKMRVLCLPGKLCLEIPIYLELGFKPENIVGVEGGDAKSREIFETNAQALGIDFRTARLEQVIKEETEPFDVVSLDFLGPICKSYMELLSNLYLSNRALLAVNFMAKRESQEIQANLRLAGQVFLQDPCERSFSEFDDLINEHDLTYDLKTSRESGYITIIASTVGSLRSENNIFGNIHHPDVVVGTVERKSMTEKVRAAQRMLSVIANYYFRIFLTGSGYSRYDVEKIICAKILPFVTRSMRSYPFVRKNERYQYSSKSQDGLASTPFNSDFFVLDTPREVYSDCSETVNFFKKILEYYLCLFSGEGDFDLEKEKHAGFRFFHKDGSKNVAFYGMKDTLAFIDSNGQPMATVNMKTFERDLQRYDKVKEGNIFDDRYKKPQRRDREKIVVQ